MFPLLPILGIASGVVGLVQRLMPAPATRLTAAPFAPDPSREARATGEPGTAGGLARLSSADLQRIGPRGMHALLMPSIGRQLEIQDAYGATHQGRLTGMILSGEHLTLNLSGRQIMVDNIQFLNIPS